MTEAFVLDEEFGPDERYRIFERTPRPWGSPRGVHLIATCGTPEAVGVALVQLAEDRGNEPAPVMGVLDGETKRWISGLWAGSGTQ